MPRAYSESNFPLHARLSTGTSVKLEGQLQKSRGSGQAYELVVDQLAVLGACGPVSLGNAGFEVEPKLTVMVPAILVISYTEEAPTSRCSSRPCSSAVPDKSDSEHVTA
jgi:hypothetical protein